MQVSFFHTVVWGLSAVLVGAFGAWAGFNPYLVASVSVIGSPVAGLSLIGILSLIRGM